LKKRDRTPMHSTAMREGVALCEPHDEMKES
jgi:hypothetical protein